MISSVQVADFFNFQGKLEARTEGCATRFNMWCQNPECEPVMLSEHIVSINNQLSATITITNCAAWSIKF